MAKLTRKTQKIFGSTAGANQLAKIGSLANGSPARYTGSTVDADTIQSLSEYLAGWFSCVVGSNSPAIEDMNALNWLFARQLAYIFQSGIPEYDASTTYYIGSIVNDGFGIPYVSLTDNNTGNAVSNASYWISLPSKLVDGVTLQSVANVLSIKNQGVDTAQLKDLSVTTGKIAASAVDSTKLASNSVTTSAITNANVTLPKLDSTLSFLVPKVMCSWHAIQTAGTYGRSGNTVTIAMTAHGMTTGQIAGLVFSAGTGGTATSGYYAITNTGANSFTIQDPSSGTITGSPSVTRNYYIYASYNITNITYTSAGTFTINFTNALSSTNAIVVSGCGNTTSNANAYLIAPNNTATPFTTTYIKVSATDTAVGTNFTYNNIVIYCA
jgi:hypothetical protein